MEDSPAVLCLEESQEQAYSEADQLKTPRKRTTWCVLTLEPRQGHHPNNSRVVNWVFGLQSKRCAPRF